MTWHGANDQPTTPQHRAPKVWDRNGIVLQPFVKLEEKYLRIALAKIATACTERGLALAELLVALPTTDEVPDQRFGREDGRTAVAIYAPYERLSTEALKAAFRRCASACVARSIDPSEVLGL